MLMFPVGAQSVKCSVCHSVTPTSAATAMPGAPGGSAGGSGPQTARSTVPAKQNVTVVVENPSTLDEQGNEVGGWLGGEMGRSGWVAGWVGGWMGGEVGRSGWVAGWEEGSAL